MGFSIRRTKVVDRFGRDVTKDPFQGGHPVACWACDGEGTLTEHTSRGVKVIASCKKCNGQGLLTLWH